MKLTELLRQRSELAAQANALARQAADVSEKLKRVDADLFARMKSLVVAIEGDDGQQEEPRTTPAIGKAPAGPEAPPKARRLSTFGKAVKDALKTAGRPMDRNELFGYLVQLGVEIPGKDKKANLSAHLSYYPEFERDGDGKWVLKESAAAE